ncbi:uncharacterized protein LOC130649525 [Hydractinia symbiolongicarpus]|uniref:uncharacterized protein LOC130649525 n=1 Tax=Hydractinia symbiolongicarpus TaxID=13093 RepID=UPI00254A1614|nr:uncharacterized protein LOC130649525 [Hydractinia symbiolongicarpus]XP_057311797.1 uncharacterized protein LOC130649525 [Hydractinia symbiolongicarpus]
MTTLKLLICLSIVNCCITLDVQNLPNVDCNSYVDFVATDPKYHRYTPYYVKLNRCNGVNVGGWKPHNKRCLPTKDGISNISILTVDSGNRFNFVTLQNHTACNERCIIDNSSCTQYQTFQPNDCDCLCKYNNPPQTNPCVHPLTWDHTKCNCVCPHTSLKCEKGKVFTKDTCGCTCNIKIRIQCTERKMLIDQNSCTCVAPNVVTGAAKGTCEGDVKGGVLAVVMIMEALAFVVAYFFLYSYCYKRQYLPRKQAKNSNLQHNNSQYRNFDAPNKNTCKLSEFNSISVEVKEEDITRKENDNEGLVPDDKYSFCVEENVSNCDDNQSHPTGYNVSIDVE